MTVAILDNHVMANLEADPVAVVISSRHTAHRVTVAVLQENTTAVIAVEVLVLLTVAVECDVLNQDV